MRYIERLRIENFQSHELTDLRLGPGFNVIVGPSDNGKTAVLRALRWALYNEPGGSDFIRRGARECRVEVTLSDGTRILRERGPKVNRYVVHPAGADPQVFEGFGTRPPAEVLRAHGMPPVALDTDNRVLLNLGTQLEGPFLLSEPASLRAKAIGRLLGVHVVDAGARLARRDLQASGRQVRGLEDELDRLDQQLAAYAELPAWEQAVAAAEERLARADQQAERARRLTALRDRLAENERAMDQARQVLARLQNLPAAEAHAARAEAAMERTGRLHRLAQRWQETEGESRSVRKRLAAAEILSAVEERLGAAARQTEKVQSLTAAQTRLHQIQQELGKVREALVGVAAAEPAAGVLEQAARQLEQAERLRGALSRWQEVSGRLEQGSQYLAEVNRDVARLAHDYEHLLRRQGRCPTCFSPITPELIQRIARELTGSQAIKEAESDVG